MVQYLAVKELHHHQDTGEYIAWGIKGCRSPDEISETADVYISDVFSSEKEAVDFAQLCTRMKLSLIHLADVVNDLLRQ